MDGIIFQSTNSKHQFTRSAHGAQPKSRPKQFVDKTKSSVFSSQTEDGWEAQQKRISMRAAAKNNPSDSFTLSAPKLVDPEFRQGKHTNKNNYISKSPIKHDYPPVVVQEVRSRNIPHLGSSQSAVAMALNQEDTIRQLNQQKRLWRPNSTFNSSIMSQCMGKGNPQAADSTAPKKKRDDFRSKFVANSGAPMQSLKDLKSKHAFMRTQSTVFDTTKAGPSFLGPAKNKSPHRRRSTMSDLMNYEPGPLTKVGFNRKSDVQGKVSGQSAKDVNSNTFQRLAGAKKERVQDNVKQLYKSSVF